MTPYDLFSLMFAPLFAMAAIWIYCVVRFVQLVRDNQPGLYDAMDLDEMWPEDLAGWLRGHNNSRPVMAMLRFVLKREDRALKDPRITRLCAFMKSLFIAFVGGFAILFFGMFGYALLHPDRPTRATTVERNTALLKRAYDLHRAQQWPEAVAAYDELIGRSDDNAEVRYWRGVAQVRLGHADDALDDFRRAREIKPDYYDAYGSAARILGDEGRLDEAIAMWNAYLERVPDDPNALYFRGGAYFRKHDLDSALTDVDKACKLGNLQACTKAEQLRGH